MWYTFLIYLGLAAFLLLTVSLLSGLRVVRVPFRVHRLVGILAFCCAAVHAVSMFWMLNF
jgi:DMSO/TMAO reductase YedYZ heme-binding membrane subunit